MRDLAAMISPRSRARSFASLLGALSAAAAGPAFAASAGGLAALALLAACAGPTAAPPLALFRHDADAEHFLGTPLSGPRPATEELAPFRIEDAWSVEVTWRPLRSIPESCGGPVGTVARLLLASTGTEEPVTPGAVSELLRRARFDFRADLGALDAELIATAGAAPESVREVRAALAPGTTALFGAAWDNGQVHGEPQVEHVELSLGRSGDRSAEGTQLAVIATTRAKRELLLLDRGPTLGGAAAVLWIPSPLEDAASGGIAVTVRVLPAPDPASARVEGHHRAFADALSDYERARKRREYWGRDLAPKDARAVERDASVALSAAGIDQIDGTFLIARSLGCPLAADMILSLEDASQDEFLREANRALRTAPAEASAEELAWNLERSALRQVLDLGLRGPLQASVKAGVARQLGSVALSFAALEDLLEACRTMSDRERFLLEHNQASLDDPSIEARVLALRWLLARGRAPSGYDPLAEGDARREQLARARAEGWR
jgi:hypothetical protein